MYIKIILPYITIDNIKNFILKINLKELEMRMFKLFII